MRNIYGTRSIIPNNYYFTFDKIYANENDVKNHNSDNILIGRTVLAYTEHTVWLKTNNGYIKVAKLDNEGRFIYGEGYVLEDNDDINNLYSKGNTYNDDGVYIVDTTNDIKGDFPKPKGTITAYEDGTTTSTYKDNSTFLLYQYSETPKESYEQLTITDENGVVINQDNAIKASKVGKILYEKSENDNKQPIYKPLVALSIDSQTVYYAVKEISVPTYQILIDITGKTRISNSEKIEDDLNLANKIFFRKVTTKYNQGLAEGDRIYTYDETIKKCIATGAKVKPDQTTINKYKKIIDTEGEEPTTWSSWYDISDQYTGYLGALNGTGFNHTNKKYDDKKASGDYLTLVDAINQLDKVIGSTNQRFNKINPTQVSTNDDGNDVSNIDDNRPVKITEDSLADTIVRHDADIGQLPLSNSEAFSNMTVVQENTYTPEDTVNKAKVRSIIDMITVLDKIIGDYREIDDNNNDSIRPTHGLDFGKNLVDNIKHISVDIGNIENLTNLNNINFTNDEKIKPIDIHSAADAIKLLDSAIGRISGLENDTNKINKNNLVESLNQLNSLIGLINNLSGTNGINKNNLVETLNQLNTKVGDVNTILGGANSIVDGEISKNANLAYGLKTLNDIIGNISLILTKEKNDETLIDVVKRLLNNIGDWSPIINEYPDIFSYLTYVNETLNNKVNKKDYQNYVDIINQLAENMDILDMNVTNLISQGGTGGTNLYWGSF